MIHCPACLNTNLEIIYRFGKAPIFNHVFFDSRDTAKKAKSGAIELRGCRGCGLVFNAIFSSRLARYTEHYDNTQNYSKFFTAFSEKLAQDLVRKYDLKNKNIVEVGCGKGNFVEILYDLGVKNMVGFDPAYTDYNPKIDRLVVKKYFNKNTIKKKADFIICRHTLEHIPKPKEFIASIVSCLAEDGKMYFEMPDLEWIVKNKTFFDFTYEHCNYFTPHSLYNLFAQFGFKHITFKKGLDGQYIQAEISRGKPNTARYKSVSFAKTGAFISSSIGRAARMVKGAGRFIVWGAGGKGVFFLNRLKVDYKRCDRVIDINKSQHGWYIPGTAQQVVAPNVLNDGGVDSIIIMNPVYKKEISQSARSFGFKGKFVVV